MDSVKYAKPAIEICDGLPDAFGTGLPLLTFCADSNGKIHKTVQKITIAETQMFPTRPIKLAITRAKASRPKDCYFGPKNLTFRNHSQRVSFDWLPINLVLL